MLLSDIKYIIKIKINKTLKTQHINPAHINVHIFYLMPLTHTKINNKKFKKRDEKTEEFSEILDFNIYAF